MSGRLPRIRVPGVRVDRIGTVWWDCNGAAPECWSSHPRSARNRSRPEVRLPTRRDRDRGLVPLWPRRRGRAGKSMSAGTTGESRGAAFLNRRKGTAPRCVSRLGHRHSASYSRIAVHLTADSTATSCCCLHAARVYTPAPSMSSHNVSNCYNCRMRYSYTRRSFPGRDEDIGRVTADVWS